MDAVEHGQSFTVTRDGHEIGELIPMRRRQRFITRAEFASGARTAPLMDIDRFRADLEDGLEPAWDDPYAR